MKRIGMVSATFTSVASAQCQPEWHVDFGGGIGGEGAIYALATFQEKLIAGGDFAEAGGQPASNIAAWDGQGWDAMGGGVNHWVFLLREWQGDLYVGGQFTQAGGEEASRIAKWNGLAWSDVGGGVLPHPTYGGYVRAMAEFQGELFIGGRFIQAGQVAASNLAAWGGAGWKGVESVPACGGVTTLAVRDGWLYVGFINCNFAGEAHRWNGTNWEDISAGVKWGGPGTSSYAVRAYGWVGDEPYLVTDQQGAQSWPPTGFFRWEQGAWTLLGSPKPYFTSNVVNDGFGFYLGGKEILGGVYRWDGTAFEPLGSGVGPTSNEIVVGMLIDGRTLYVGGNFTIAGGKPASKIAAWSCVCPSDCDNSGSLDIDDFVCFTTIYSLGQYQADCDGSGALTIDDFVFFQTLFALGC